MDLKGVCGATALLVGDRGSLAFLLGLENESYWYWNLPLEDSLLSALGINHNNLA